MGRKTAESNGTITSPPPAAPEIPVPSLIITRADRAVWEECCERLGFDGRNRMVRYITIGHDGIVANVKGVGLVKGRWATTASA